MLKHHPGRRCTFAVRAAGRALVGKAFGPDDVFAAQLALLRALERHGLAGNEPPTARAWSPPTRACGSSCSSASRARGAPPCWLVARPPGGWPRRGCAASGPAPIRLGPSYGPDAFLARVRRNCVPIAAASPRLGARAAAIVAALAECPPGPGEPVLVHGSFSPAHVIDLGGGAGVIDWDGFAQGPRELDAATFLATAARMAGGRPAVARPAAAAAAAFRGAIAADVDPAALDWYEAGARIRNARHVCVHRPPDWAARTEALLTPVSVPQSTATATG